MNSPFLFKDDKKAVARHASEVLNKWKALHISVSKFAKSLDKVHID